MMNDGLQISDKRSSGIGKVQEAKVGIFGHLKIEQFGPDGKLKDIREESNTVTVLALAMIADQLDDSPSIAIPDYMEVGEGSGQDTNDATLASYLSGSRTAITSATAAAAVVTYVCTFGAGVAEGAITEAGLFNVVTQNTTDLILYDDFTVMNIGSADSLVITWTLTFAAL